MINGQFICCILFAFSVSVSEQENQNNQSLIRGHYSFNHPPSFEDYNTLLELERSEGKFEKTETLKNGAISTRSLKSVIPVDKSIEDDLFENNDENISAQDKKVEKIRRESRSDQTTVTIISELDQAQENNIFERNSKASNKTQSRRRNLVKKLKSKTNQANAVVTTKNVQKYVTTESVTEKLAPALSKDVDKVTSPEERPIKKHTRRLRERKPVVPIVENQNYVYSHTGDFHYSYESGDGTKAFERGELKTYEDKTAGEAVVGSFSYTDKDGNDFSLSYTADENGYRPEGAHLPTPPPIPPAIARALLYLSTKSTPQPATESSV